MKNFLFGVKILSVYKEPKERWEISAEHDIIYTSFDVPPCDMMQYDCDTLDKLGGWHWDTEYECWAFFT